MTLAASLRYFAATAPILVGHACPLGRAARELADRGLVTLEPYNASTWLVRLPNPTEGHPR